MAPTHSKPVLGEKKRSAKKANMASFMKHPIQKLQDGEAVFSDEFVDAMAEGKKFHMKGDFDSILVEVDSEKENENVSRRCSKKPKSYKSSFDVEDVEVCPKYATKRGVFAVWEDATYYSDGDVKHFNIKCQETDSSPCSFCTGHSGDDKDTYVKTPSPEAKGSEFAQAKGFDINDYEGEEDTPKKISGNGCKWCKWDPCILENEEVNEEARVIVDNLISQEEQGIELNFRNYRYALYRMYARALGYTGYREILPVCVQCYVDKHFVEEGEARTGFKSK